MGDLGGAVVTALDKAGMVALADRVEALTGPCRETGAEIYLALHLPNWRDGEPWKATNGWFKKNCAEDAIAYFFHDGMGGRSVTVKPYTASLDAAITLVPEGSVWTLEGGDSNSRGIAWVRNMDGDTVSEVNSHAATPALALTAAALRAIAAGRP